MRMLVAEDDASAARLLQHVLERYGFVELAENGQVAVDKFNAAVDEGKPYDLIMLDIMMPEMNGQIALREIRARENELGIADADGVKVIMLSALDDSENILNAFQVGCEAYLTKPVNMKKLVNQLSELGFVLEEQGSE